MKNLLILIICLGTAYLSAAQEKEPVSHAFQGTRLVNAHSANLVEKGEMLLLIQHRFGDISGGLYQLFGLDQASMRLGFEYGFTENFTVGFGRSTYLKTYDAFGKVRIAAQNAGFPLTVAINAGGYLPTLRNFYPESADKFSWMAQLHLARTFGKVSFQVSPGYLSTGYLMGANKSLSVFTSGLGGSVRVTDKMSLNIEYLLNFNDEITNSNPLSVGMDLDTGGHLFQLIISNNQRMFDREVFTGATGDWTTGNLFFGFNLIREFDINKPLEF
jgi:hypothetical protein